MRIVIYARKSTDREDRQVQSLEDQIQILTDLARREGFTVDEVFEESVSAKLPGTRPEFARLIDEIQKGRIRGILAWEINRLVRNSWDGGTFSHLLQYKHFDFVLTPRRKYLPEDGALLMAVETGMATDYIHKLRHDVQRGMNSKASRGWHPCKAPVGYLNDPETRTILPDPKRFRTVRLAFEEIMAGATVAETYRKLCRRGLTVRNRKGTRRPLSRARLHTLLREPFYMGALKYAGQQYVGRHKPMLTPEEFNLVQSKLALCGKKPVRIRRSLALSGGFRCKRCGCNVVGEVRKKAYPRAGRVATYTYYHCTGARGCSKKSIREEDLYGRLRAALDRIQLPAEIWDFLDSAVGQALETTFQSRNEGQAGLRTDLERAEGRLSRLTDMRLEGDIGSSEYAELRTELLAQCESIRLQLEASMSDASRIQHMIRSALSAGRQAADAQGFEATCKATRLLGATLNLETSEMQLNPILEKIATFEPLRESSQSAKSDDFIPLSSIWWTLANDLLTTATDIVKG